MILHETDTGDQRKLLHSLVEPLYRVGSDKGISRRGVFCGKPVHLSIHCFRGIIYERCLANGPFDMVEADEKMALGRGALSPAQTVQPPALK